jgi:hypothetical protein
MYKRNESEIAKAMGHTGNVKTKMPEEVRAKFVEIGALKP